MIKKNVSRGEIFSSSKSRRHPEAKRGNSWFQLIRFPNLNNPQIVQYLHHRIDRIHLKPFVPKIRAVWIAMVIILEKFAKHQEIKWRCILGLVVIVEIGIAVFVATPVDYSAMQRAHQVMDWQ